MGQPDVSDVHEPGLMGPKRKRKKRKKSKAEQLFPETMGVAASAEDVYKVVFLAELDKKMRAPEKERPTLGWPHLYDILRGKGYSKEKAARISNSRRGRRKKGRWSTKAGRAAAKARRAAKVEKTMAKYMEDE